MSINISRFYRMEKLELDCEIITPMFLGNASKEAELRSSPFKGVIRYWWRVANGIEYKSYNDLLAAENRIFGSSDGSTGGKSRVKVDVLPGSSLRAVKTAFQHVGKIKHPECNHPVDPLGYLAGMGLIHYKKGILHSYFAPGGHFTMILSAPADIMEELRSTLELLRMFGAAGSRCRNGWGSLMIHHESFIELENVVEWKNAFEHDYPHCLGMDGTGALCWKTGDTFNSWELCMKELAKIYVAIRAGNNQLNIQGLDVVNGTRPERHLLGYPVTHHSLQINGWGNSGRHASALRLKARKEGNAFRGYILHLPHRFSDRMWPNEKERQIEIWTKVHQNLDKLCERAEYREVA